MQVNELVDLAYKFGIARNVRFQPARHASVITSRQHSAKLTGIKAKLETMIVP